LGGPVHALGDRA